MKVGIKDCIQLVKSQADGKSIKKIRLVSVFSDKPTDCIDVMPNGDFIHDSSICFFKTDDTVEINLWMLDAHSLNDVSYEQYDAILELQTLLTSSFPNISQRDYLL